MFTRKILFILILLFYFVPSVAQNYFDADKLDEYITKAVEDYEATGFTIGIIKNGDVLFSKGYGVRSVETTEPVTDESIFAIASCSKAFTTAALGILVDEGLISWDDKVTDHLPWFQLHDSYVTSEMRIRDLVTHRSGFATFDGDLLWYGTNYTREDVVYRIRELPLKHGFRFRYGYSNVMFIAAGLVIEEVSGMSWDEFLQERILNPLEMNSTTTSINDLTNAHELALPHLDGKPIEWINYDNVGPAASLNSNVDDLLNWVQMWLNNGSFEDQQILSPETVQEIFSAQTPLSTGSANKPGGMHFRNYGLGWYLADHSGRRIIWHDGGLPGFLSKVALVPEENLGIVMMTNSYAFLNTPVVNKIYDMFMNEKDVDYATEFLERVKTYKKRLADAELKREESRVTGTTPSKKIEAYTGSYTDAMYGDAEIVLSDGKLVLTMLPSSQLFTSNMEHWHFDTFRIKFKDEFLPHGFVTFNFNSRGEITGFKIDLPNPDFHFYNLDFEKIDNE